MARIFSVSFVLILVAAEAAAADPSFTVLRTFAESPKSPLGRLVEAPDGALYGVASGGGTFGHGALLRYDRANGRLLATVLHSFNGADGASPQGALTLLPDGTLYGTAASGGDNDRGTIFAVAPDGTFRVVHSFLGPEGEHPMFPLIQASDGNLYGATTFARDANGTEVGGSYFRLTPDGVLTTIRSTAYPSIIGNPLGPLVNGPDGYLYGLSDESVSLSSAIFRMDLQGNVTILTQLLDYGFAGAKDLLFDADGYFYAVGVIAYRDGTPTYLIRVSPTGALTYLQQLPFVPQSLMRASSGEFYFALKYGGPASSGIVYKVAPGAAPVAVHTMIYWDGSGIDGLMQTSAGELYGTAESGGLSRRGVVFRVTSAGAFSVQQMFIDLTPLNPVASLVEGTDGALYGTTCGGGFFNAGTVFRLTTSGDLTVLHSFAYLDGWCPLTELFQGRDGSFYGTAVQGGFSGLGTIFRITSSGQFALMHSFHGSDGGTPVGGLIQAADGSFYGTTTASLGNVFRMTPAGEVTVLHWFGGELAGDGSIPVAPLIQAANGMLYGTTRTGGPTNCCFGTAFRIDGGQYSLFANFGDSRLGAPSGRLAELADGIYGSTYDGVDGPGGIFRMSSAGVFTQLHVFSGADGAHPWGGLSVGADGALYGTTTAGGPRGAGTLFRIDSSGAFTNLYSFSGPDGQLPTGALTPAADRMLYGTTAYGGPGGAGVLFRIAYP